MGIGDYAVEHFIPFQFVTHDLMWNLIPSSPSFNSLKGDKLPDLNLYFKSFYELPYAFGTNLIERVMIEGQFI